MMTATVSVNCTSSRHCSKCFALGNSSNRLVAQCTKKWSAPSTHRCNPSPAKSRPKVPSLVSRKARLKPGKEGARGWRELGGGVPRAKSFSRKERGSLCLFLTEQVGYYCEPNSTISPKVNFSKVGTV